MGSSNTNVNEGAGPGHRFTRVLQRHCVRRDSLTTHNPAGCAGANSFWSACQWCHPHICGLFHIVYCADWIWVVRNERQPLGKMWQENIISCSRLSPFGSEPSTHRSGATNSLLFRTADVKEMLHSVGLATIFQRWIISSLKHWFIRRRKGKYSWLHMNSGHFWNVEVWPCLWLLKEFGSIKS